MPNFHLFTMVWGAHHIGLFKRSCFRSMNWPKNREAISGSTWNIFTKQEHFDELENLFKDQPYKLKLFAIADSMRVAGCGFVKTNQCDQGVISLNGLRDQIQYSIQHKSKMLLAPPDTIFGDGTVSNIIKLGTADRSVVCVAHPRVLPGIMDELEELCATRGGLDNSKLVTMAMKHPHKAWEFAEIGHKNNNSYIGGIAWQKLNHGLYSITHRLPTPYLIDFDTSDWDWWWGTVSFGGLDHSWPGDRLIRQERLRYAGSSDACFIVEITDHDKNVPPILESPQTGDQYWGDRLHHSTNRLFNVIWRGD